MSCVPCPMSHVSCLGFTLVELIVVSALLMIVGGGLFTVFMTGQISYLSADAYVQVQQEARRAFDNVVRELREAGPSTGPPPPIISVTGPPYPATNQLNFQIARGYNSEPPCQSPNPVGICWGSETPTGIGEWVHYATLLPGTGNTAQLIRWRDTDPVGGTPPSPCSAPTCRVLANHVQSASFNYNGGTKVVTVTLQIRYNSPLLPSGSQATPTLTSQVKLRNP